MIIDQGLCTKCGKCIPTCPVSAIHVKRPADEVAIDQDCCVECEVCYRSGVCEPGALTRPILTWPRTVRSALSNPLVVHKETRVPGRGTEEMKTNDVTGRFRPGQVGIAVEMGRPGISSSFHDVQKVTRVCASHGASFEPKNPVTCLMIDREKGILNPEMLNERVLSAIIEFEVPIGRAIAILRDLRAIADHIDTVFSLNLICLLKGSDVHPFLNLLRDEGFQPSTNGKTNVGLGKPAYSFEEIGA